MTVLARSALEASPLADLHAIASELSIDGYRRLRKPALIDAILAKQEGGEAPAAPEAEAPAAPEAEAPAPARSSGRTRRRARTERVEEPDEAGEAGEAEQPEEPEEREALEVRDEPVEVEPVAAESNGGSPAVTEDEEEAAGGRRRRGRRGGRGRSAGAREEAETPETADAAEAAEEPRTAAREEEPEEEPGASEDLVEGVVELLPNGSGFVRVDPPDPSDDDVYISSAQVKRCELVSGDRVAGPKRAPRRSERFASLIRIETINGRPASELADSVRYDDLPATFPDDRLEIGSEDPTLKAIEWLTPFGKGSRVTIIGAARAGKSEALRRLAQALADRDDLALSVVLAGVRPEEISSWSDGPVTPTAAVSFAASEDARNAAIEPAIDQARRLAARGADAVVLIDTLDGATPSVARKAMAAARNLADGGSLTIIATASAPLGGETTVVALDVGLAGLGRFPALDLLSSGTLRPELLVGEAGAEAIARTRAEAAEAGDGR